ncbi:hypothetical protein GQ53DRAFT_887855 [Thozetella sp. PMI_491]|nr:hypothetical protein GQ53DRAFT_887855 [Thozetella sp. PMI_491]
MDPTEYPGMGLPLRHYPQEDFNIYPMGTHGNCLGSKSDLLPVREVAMMYIMNQLTDKDGWHWKVFNEEIISKWREKTLAIPDTIFERMAAEKSYREKGRGADDNVDNPFEHHNLDGIVSAEVFDYCMAELRSKALRFEKSGIVPVLDATASVAKSDTLVTQALRDVLRSAFDKLKAEQGENTDWHPNSGDKVQDLVHPSMYPLVFGRSKVFADELVGVEDAIDKWAGKGEVIPKEVLGASSEEAKMREAMGGDVVPATMWSDTYQWLPANLEFQENGKVKFTSYINNLHPNRHPEIYRAIEELIETAALPAWDQCLALAMDYRLKRGPGRVSSRFTLPDNPDDDNMDLWIPSDYDDVANVEINWDKFRKWEHEEYEEDVVETEEEELIKKWKLLRRPRQPQPDPFRELKYAPRKAGRLARVYEEEGLQVIIKMASIELTPEKPDFPAGSWHVEGQMNEHIVATALYYLDSENITPSTLSFRMQTSASLGEEIQVDQGNFRWLEKVHGTGLGYGSACLQNYGSVETREGRLLAFPNVFQHCVSPFRLADPTKPGHRRFIAIWLVDPDTRIISTANVPPQQLDWWVDSAFGATPAARAARLAKLPAEVAAVLREKGIGSASASATDPVAASREAMPAAKLPAELMNMIYRLCDEDGPGTAVPMSAEEAREHRLELMQARSRFDAAAEKWWHQHSYNFCEH